MGAFKELLVDSSEVLCFSESNMSMEALERELELLDLKLKFIEDECMQIVESASMFLQRPYLVKTNPAVF